MKENLQFRNYKGAQPPTFSDQNSPNNQGDIKSNYHTNSKSSRALPVNKSPANNPNNQNLGMQNQKNNNFAQNNYESINNSKRPEHLMNFSQNQLNDNNPYLNQGNNSAAPNFQNNYINNQNQKIVSNSQPSSDDQNNYSIFNNIREIPIISNTEELIKTISSLKDEQNGKTLIDFNKYLNYVKISDSLLSSPNNYIKVSKIISIASLGTIIAIQSNNTKYYDSEFTSYFFKNISKIIKSEDLLALRTFIKNPSIDFISLFKFLQKIDSQIVSYFLQELKTNYSKIFSNKCNLFDLISTVSNLIEENYHLPLILIFKAEGSWYKVKKGNFLNPLRIIIGFDLEQYENSIYIFISSSENSLNQNIMTNNQKYTISNDQSNHLKKILEELKRSSHSSNISYISQEIQNLTNANIKYEDITQILLSFISKEMSQLSHISLQRESDNLEEEKDTTCICIQIKDILCEKCNYKKTVHFFTKLSHDYKSNCFKCEYEYILSYIGSSERTGKCQICGKNKHTNEIRIMKSILSSMPTKLSSSSKVELYGFDEDNNGTSSQEEIVEAIQKKSILFESQRKKASEKNLPQEIKKDNFKEQPIIEEICMFCEQKGENLQNQNNCQREGKYHFYHDNCLLNFAKEKVNESKTLDDVVCQKCKNGFDYKTISDLDKQTADFLARNKLPSPEILKSKYKKIEKSLLPQETKIHRCDIKHDHIKEDSNICLQSENCIHFFFKGCLGDYIKQMLPKTKSLTQIKCPVSICKVNLSKNLIFNNFQKILSEMGINA